MKMIGMAAERKPQNNVKMGYNLAAEALDYLADKLSSIRNNEQLRVNNELIKHGVDVSVEDLRQKARLLREFYQRQNTPSPTRGSKERERYILSQEEEWSEVNSMKGLICSALQVYGDDLRQTREDIPRLVRTRKPSEEYSKAFLQMDDVETQLEIIDEAMRKDYCGK